MLKAKYQTIDEVYQNAGQYEYIEVYEDGGVVVQITGDDEVLFRSDAPAIELLCELLGADKAAI